MTKKLEELFELPQDDIDSLAKPTPENAQEITTEALDSLSKIEQALPQVRGLEAADDEMDSLATLAQDSYKDLMDLGMQVDSRYASEIFNVAGTMLGHAITAKTAKLNKKLKMIDLQLKKAQLDQKEASREKEIEATPVGEGRELDRNELLKMLRDTYNEIPIAMGITNDNANSTMSLWVSPKEKTWTIIATKQAISCAIGTGTDFDFVPYKKKNTL